MYYVAYITEYPIYEPAEGGYYYAGTQIQMCREFRDWKKANRFYQKCRKEFIEMHEDEPERVWEYACGGIAKWGGSHTAYTSRYIGEGERVEISKKKPVEHGWTPYC